MLQNLQSTTYIHISHSHQLFRHLLSPQRNIASPKRHLALDRQSRHKPNGRPTLHQQNHGDTRVPLQDHQPSLRNGNLRLKIEKHQSRLPTSNLRHRKQTTEKIQKKWRIVRVDNRPNRNRSARRAPSCGTS